MLIETAGGRLKRRAVSENSSYLGDELKIILAAILRSRRGLDERAATVSDVRTSKIISTTL